MHKIIAFLASFLFFCTAYADARTRAFELNLAKLVRSPAFVERVLDEYGVAGMPRQVLREHIQELYKHNEVITMLVKEALNAGAEAWNDDKSSDYAKKFGTEVFISYAIKGLRRLTIEEQRMFIKYMLNWMQVASHDDCKKMLVTGGTTSSLDDAYLEMKYYHRMEKEELRSYFSMIRRAIVAEIRDYPGARNLNQQQAQIADDAFQNELMKRVDSGLIDEKLLIAMGDMSNANPKVACSAGEQIFSTMLDMKGFTGELFLIKFTNSLQ